MRDREPDAIETFPTIARPRLDLLVNTFGVPRRRSSTQAHAVGGNQER